MLFEQKNQAAPAIISASRATDIPAFHMPWFMERLRAGFCIRINPFNTQQRTVVSFSQCAFIIFWTKDPRPLIPHLDEIKDRGFDCLVHYTVNDYETEKLEPRVPPLGVRIQAFDRLAKRLENLWGPERLIWRFDPILTGEALPVPLLLKRIDALGAIFCQHTEQLVFSLLDMYPRPAARLRNHAPSLRPPDEAQCHELAEGLATCNARWARSLRLASCAERVDLSAWGIAHSACIDPELLHRLHPEDPRLAALCPPPEQRNLLGEEPRTTRARSTRGGGWRPDCRCAPNRDIGAYSTCMHACVYCYANHSQQAVIANLNSRTAKSESLL